MELDDLEGLIQFRPFYDMLFQQVIHVCERDLMLIALLIFKNRELNGIAQCMHKLGLLELYQALERGSREVHTIPKMTAYEQQTSSSQKLYGSLTFPLHTDQKNFSDVKQK